MATWTGKLDNPPPLSEDMSVPVGQIVSYLAKGEEEVGVVIGTDARDLFVIGAVEPKLFNKTDRIAFRDAALTTRFGKQLRFKGVVMDVQKVPNHLAHRVGRIQGSDLRLYHQLAATLSQMRGT